MERITQKKLQARVDHANDKLGLSQDHATHEVYLDGAYGGWRVVLREKKNGCQRDLSARGTARTCYDYVSAMIAGINLQNQITYGKL